MGRIGCVVRATALSLAVLSAPAVAEPPRAIPGLEKINHIVVIYLENRSFDHLYGAFPGAEGIAHAGAAALQVDENGHPYERLPAFNGPAIDASRPSLKLPELPNKPFDLASFIPIDRPMNAQFEKGNNYYQAQQSINGGKMDRFVSVSGSPTMGYFDGSLLPMWRFARQFVLADHFFQAAFGGTAMNHMLLFCACVPAWPNAPVEITAQVDNDGKLAKDGIISPDGFMVNNLVAYADRAPLQSTPHIGDRMDAAKVSWTWYSGDWNKQKNRDNKRPFLLFRNLAVGTPGADAHLRDDEEFVNDLRRGTLPSVSFVKPAAFNEHPNQMSGLLRDDTHTAELVKAVQESAYWSDSVIIVTYDEGHSFWDHVAPPKVDRWGPGRRIPAIIISPFAKTGFVDHTQYDTTSILKLIETRFGLEPLGTRDAAVADLTESLNLR